MRTEDLDFLKSLPLFSGTDPDLLLRIFTSEHCKLCAFSEKAVILSPSEGKRSAGVVISGRVVAETSDPGRRMLLRYLHKGDFFGIANLFSEEAYVSTVRADDVAEVFLMQEEAIRVLLEEDKAFLYRYLAFLSGRIRYLNRKIRYLTAGSAERRLAVYLSSLDGDTVRPEESFSSLSDLLDLGRASLYRAFDRLCADGYIEKEGKNIRILDRDALLLAYR